MEAKRIVGTLALLVAVAACGDGEGGTEEADRPTTTVVVGVTEPLPAQSTVGPSIPSACSGEEIGTAPMTIPTAGTDGPSPFDRGFVDVARGPGGVVYAVTVRRVYCVDGDRVFEVATPATSAVLAEPDDVDLASIAVGPDGVPVVADWQGSRTYAVRDGDLSLVPGSDDPAIGSTLQIAVGPDETLYVAGQTDEAPHVIDAVADGSSRPYAGGAVAPVAGDGGPAVESWVDLPMGMAVADDGSLFFVDAGTDRLAVVDPSGTIETVAGGVGFDDRPSSEVIADPQDVAVEPDGSPLVLVSGRGEMPLTPGGIHRVGSDGAVEPVLAPDGRCTPAITASEIVACDRDDYSVDTLYRFDVDADGGLWLIDDITVARVVGRSVQPVLVLARG